MKTAELDELAHYLAQAEPEPRRRQSPRGGAGPRRVGSAVSQGRSMNNNLQDLVDEFRSFRPNSRVHADFLLRNGRLHPEAHWVIQERLAKWVRRIEAAGPEVRGEVLAELEGVLG